MLTSAVVSETSGIGPQSSTAPLQSLSIASWQNSGEFGLIRLSTSSQSVFAVL
jgi:hypothetical protein